MSTTKIDFSLIGLDIPNNIYNLPIEEQQDVYNYLCQMNETQKKAYLIAMSHLGTSFNVCKSNGYKEWKNHKNK